MKGRNYKYSYERCGKLWAVYKWTYGPCGCASGEKVAGDLRREEAVRKVYELNGWEAKPC